MDSKILIYTGLHVTTGEIIGHIALSEIDRENKSARVGKIIIDKKQRNKGFGQDMIKEVLNIAFERLKLHRVSLGVFASNKPAIVCYKNVGFVLEGTLRDERRFENEYWDLCEMSILEDEWQEIKKINL